MRRDEQTELERALALKLYWSNPSDGVAARRRWHKLTGKSDRAYYRRLAEGKKDLDHLTINYPDLAEAYHLRHAGQWHPTWTDDTDEMF